ncbi:hypothetical protein ACUXA2_001253 [Staphylococcus hominis]
MKRNIILVLFILNALFGLIGVVWSLLITETICSLLAMFIACVLRNELTLDTQALVEE